MNKDNAVLNIALKSNITLTEIGAIGVLEDPSLFSLTDLASHYDYSNAQCPRRQPTFKLASGETGEASGKVTPTVLCDILNMDLPFTVYYGICLAFGRSKDYDEQMTNMNAFLLSAYITGNLADEQLDEVLAKTGRKFKREQVESMKDRYNCPYPHLLTEDGLALAPHDRRAIFIELLRKASIAKGHSVEHTRKFLFMRSGMNITAADEIKSKLVVILGSKMIKPFENILNMK